MKVLASLIIGLSPLGAFAQITLDENKLTSNEFISQWHNDLLSGSDEGYTNGNRLAYAYDLEPSKAFLAGADRVQLGFGITHLMFTPGDEAAVVPARGERPYAGWAGFEITRQESGDGWAKTATLTFGLSGEESRAEELQDWIHENVTNSATFQGWGSQAPTEITLNFHYDHKKRLDFLTSSGLIQTDGFVERGFSLGNFRTDVYVGSKIRFGYNLPRFDSSPYVQIGSLPYEIFEGGENADSDYSFYGFLGGRIYGIAHDISLDGPLFSNWSESVGSKPLVGEVSVGVTVRYKQLDLSLSQTVRSDEFSGQNSASHYGSVVAQLKTCF